MPRLTISSAISRLVQWVMGRPDWLGASQAMAAMAQICSGVIRGRLPERGASRRRSSKLNSDKEIDRKSIQRSRQSLTVSRLTCRARAMAKLLRPSAASKMRWARRAICCGVECLRMRRCKASRWSSVSSTSTGLGPRMMAFSGWGPVQYRENRLNPYYRDNYAKVH